MEAPPLAKVVLVPTPIGNLEDITIRAIRVLNEANIIAAEDTRHTSKLLKHLRITKPLFALHQHNEHTKVPILLEQVLLNHLLLAVVTDAGTPGISDPGFLIIREALERNIIVEALPGPTALIPALVASGFPCDRFIFEGFLPHQKGRKTRLSELANESRTMVFYESPYRIVKTLEQMAEYFTLSRKVSIAREISKIHEEYHRGTLEEMIKYFKHVQPKGEFVLVVAGKS